MQTHPIRRTFHRFGVTVLLAIAAIALVACTDDDDPDTSDATATEASTTTTATATPTEAATETATETATATTEATTATDGAGGATVSISEDGPLAPYLVGPEGLTLYLFTNDEDGVSNCTEGCLANWPPLLIAEGEEPTADEGVSGELGVIERADGEGRQVTYNGMPLYYWAADTAPGETTGHEVGGVWFVVPPDEGASMGASRGAAGSGSLPGY